MPRSLKFRPPTRPDLTIDLILGWADDFNARTGRWPTRKDGRIGLTTNTWSAVDAALKVGGRGLNRGSSLAKLLLARRGRRHKKYLPHLTPALILGWADAHHTRTGEWPHQDTGPVADAAGETWAGIDTALWVGGRGLPGNSSVPQLLAAARGVRNHLALSRLTAEQVLVWVDAHYARTGEWPNRDSGPVVGASGEVWSAVNTALNAGNRGLAEGGSLARLLSEHRGLRHPAELPRLAAWEVLLWADAHHERTGHWPTAESGPVAGAPGEKWSALDTALRDGTRGLPGGDSLARLLARRRGRLNRGDRPRLTVRQIIRWADAYHRRTGRWPVRETGPITDTSGETWVAVHNALSRGCRGLPGGSSLAQLLEDRRGVRNNANAPRLTCEQILTWADSHHTRTGDWPSIASGEVVGAAGEAWSGLNAALRTGRRGLSGGNSLARLLAAERGARNHLALPPLTCEQILAWADVHHARTGRWPVVKGGPIVGAQGESWSAVDAALREGLRSLPGGDSLARLLKRRRGTGDVSHPGTTA